MARTKVKSDKAAPSSATAGVELESLLDPEMSEVQRRIVSAAVEVFAAQGYSGTATKEIATRAGVAEGTIFRYYKTKKDLLVGAVAPMFMRAITPMLRRSVEHVLNANYETFADFVRAFAVDRLAFARSHPTLLKLVAQEMPFHPELRGHFERIVFAELFPMASRAIVRFQKRGEVWDLPPMIVLRIVASVVAGFVVTRVFVAPDADWDDDEEIEIIAAVLSRGLAVSEAGGSRRAKPRRIGARKR